VFFSHTRKEVLCVVAQWIFPLAIYRSMKEGSLLCSYEIHWTRMLQIVLLVSLESSQQGGVHGLWFHDIWTCGATVLEYWMISSLKTKLNHSWKYRRNWNVPLVFLERSWWALFNEIYLVRFGFRMWEILILKWFLSLKIQINSRENQGLEGKISWEYEFALEPTAQATLLVWVMDKVINMSLLVSQLKRAAPPVK
jgi:hypothetical protein